MLQLDWVSTWDGWVRIRNKLMTCNDDNLKQALCEDAVKEFCNTCINDVVAKDSMSDMQRQEQLLDLGYMIGKATGHNCNCLIDSILQLLMYHKVENGPPANFSVQTWRNELCEMTRAHLCKHENVALRPRLRDENYKVIDASDDEHARAFLEHHKHLLY